jgi:hypothetical protein
MSAEHAHPLRQPAQAELQSLALQKMSTDDKTRAAAAQQAIDDEPDDWCVQLMRSCKRNPAADEQTGTRGSSAQAAQVGATQPVDGLMTDLRIR